MSITTLPVVADFGGTKANEYAEVDSGKQLAAAAYNALTGRVIDAYSAIGLDDGTTSGSLRQALTARVITADATLAATDRVIIIDSADPTISVTLDAGSATRAPVEILWPGDAVTATMHVLTIVRNGGTGTIDGAPSSKVISSLARGMRVRLWATDANEWHTDATEQFGDIQFVSTSTATIIKPLVYVTYAGAVTLTAPPVGAMPRFGVYRAGIAYAIDINRAGSDTINGSTTFAIPVAYAGAELIGFSAGTWGAGLTLSPTGVHARLDALEVTGRQVVTGASATILATTRVVYIDHAAARVDLTLPATPFEPFTIVKRATSGSFKTRLIPASGSDAIQGLAAGTNFDIPGSDVNASTTTTRPSFLVTSSVVNVVDVS